MADCFGVCCYLSAYGRLDGDTDGRNGSEPRFVGGMGSSLVRDGGPSWRRGAGRMAAPRDLERPPELEMRLSCLLLAAFCGLLLLLCVWCDGWTGWSIIIGGAGKDFQERRTARHTPRTPSPSVPTGRLSSRGSSLDGTRPGAGLRLFATGLRRLFGRLALSSRLRGRWIDPVWGRDAGIVAFPQNADAIATTESHQERTRKREPCPRGKGEKNPPNLFSFTSLPLAGLTGRGGQRPIGGTDDM